MTLKKLLVPSIILTVIGLAFKIGCTIFNLNGSGFFLSSDACNIIVGCTFILLFVIGFVMSVADRKKEFVSEPSKNIVCGVFGFLASVMIIGVGVVQLLTWNGVNIVENILAVAAGFVLLYEACISFTGSNGMKKIPVVALIVPIWSCMRFVSLFVDYTTKSLKAVELFDIVEVAFLMLFFYYQSMYFAGVNNKLSVRRAPVYGSVFIMLGLIVVCDMFIKMFMGPQTVTNVDTQIVQPTITNILTLAGDFFLCIYAFCIIRDMLSGAEKSIASGAAAAAENAEDKDGDTPVKTPAKPFKVTIPDEPVSAETESEPEKEKVSEEKTESAAEPKQEVKAESDPETVSEQDIDESFESKLPKVAAPAEKPVDTESGAYSELLDMIDKM